MTPLEIGGAVLIGGVVPAITAIKARRKIKAENSSEGDPTKDGENGDKQNEQIEQKSSQKNLSERNCTIQDERTPLLA